MPPKRKKTVGAGFQIRGRFVRGLCPTLAKFFFPLYSRNAAKPAPNTSIRPQRSRPLTKSISGLQLGRKVDEQVQAIGAFCIQHLLPPECFAVDIPPSENSCGAAYRQALIFYNGMHDYTHRFFKTLTVHGLDLVAVQSVVGSSYYKVATAVDVVCRKRTDGSLVIVELKTGYDRYYEHFCGRLLSPFETQVDSARNQHQLQLGFTAQLYASQHRRDVSGYVFRIHRDGESIYPLESWVRENIRSDFEAILKNKPRVC